MLQERVLHGAPLTSTAHCFPSLSGSDRRLSQAPGRDSVRPYPLHSHLPLQHCPQPLPFRHPSSLSPAPTCSPRWGTAHLPAPRLLSRSQQPFPEPLPWARPGATTAVPASSGGAQKHPLLGLWESCPPAQVLPPGPTPSTTGSPCVGRPPEDPGLVRAQPLVLSDLPRYTTTPSITTAPAGAGGSAARTTRG